MSAEYDVIEDQGVRDTRPTGDRARQRAAAAHELSSIIGRYYDDLVLHEAISPAAALGHAVLALECARADDRPKILALTYVCEHHRARLRDSRRRRHPES